MSMSVLEIGAGSVGANLGYRLASGVSYSLPLATDGWLPLI